MKRTGPVRARGGWWPLALSLFVATHAWAGPTVCAAGATTPGIDVSKWQGAIDWAKVAKTQKFVIARVSDGTYLDTWFDSYWPDIAAHGMVRGAYQFFEPAQDPIVQADILLQKMGPMVPGMLPPTLDVEATGGKTPAQVEAGVQQWVDYVTAKLGVAPIIYTGNWFWDPNVGSSAQSGLPVWVSYYCSGCCPKIPLPWKTWAIWQYSDKGAVSGVAGNCDMNQWNGDLASLQSFANVGGVVVPACGDGNCAPPETCGFCPTDCGTCPVADAGSTDSGVADVGSKDTGIADAGVKDTAIKDAAVKDTGVKDTGAKDTGLIKDAAPKDLILDPCAACPNACVASTGQCVDCLVSSDCAPGQQCLPGNVCASVCGDGVCAGDEFSATCCLDCPCPGGKGCVAGQCTNGSTCSDNCPSLYAVTCVDSNHYHVCQKVAGGCLQWDPLAACQPDLVCAAGLCVDPASIVDVQSGPDAGTMIDAGEEITLKDAPEATDLSDGGKVGDGKVRDQGLAEDSTVTQNQVKFVSTAAPSGCSARPSPHGSGSATGLAMGLVTVGLLRRRRLMTRKDSISRQTRRAE